MVANTPRNMYVVVKITPKGKLKFVANFYFKADALIHVAEMETLAYIWEVTEA